MLFLRNDKHYFFLLKVLSNTFIVSTNKTKSSSGMTYLRKEKKVVETLKCELKQNGRGKKGHNKPFI